MTRALPGTDPQVRPALEGRRDNGIRVGVLGNPIPLRDLVTGWHNGTGGDR